MKAVASEAQSLRYRNPSVKMDSESIFDNDAANPSVFHHEAASGYAPSELNFVFDDQVINSQAYRRVFVKAQSESQPPHIRDAESDTGTVKEVAKDPVQSQKNSIFLDRDSIAKVAADAKDFMTPWLLKQESGNWKDLEIVRPIRLAGKTPCYGCLRSIAKDHLRALGGTWHIGCFKCSDCGTSLESGYYLSQEENGKLPKPVCENDYIRRRDVQCSKCQHPIIGNFVTAFDRWYHAYHFTCDRCDTAFTKESDCYQHNGSIYCMLHFCREAAYYCHACKFPIMGKYSEKEGEKGKWHDFCLELESWGLVLPVSANGRRYLASIQDQSLKHLSCFYQQLHDNRAKYISLCGSRYVKEFRDILTVCLEASRWATIRQSDTQFAAILTRLSCLFRATWTATPDGNFRFDEGEVGAFTSAFMKNLKCYGLGGWKRTSPEIVAQCISDLLKPLLRFCFHKRLRDNNFSWDVKHEQLDQLTKALGYSSFWPYKLESRYNPIPNVYGEQNWRCTICLHEITGIVLSECSYPFRKLHPHCHSLASQHRSTGALADCTSPCTYCELEKSNFYSIHSHDIALYEIWRAWHFCLNPVKSYGELVFVDLTEQEPSL